MAKILLVEDDNNLREIYEARLMAEGYDIVSARDGEEALTVAMKEKPDLIISDVMMPKISGFDMLDILRSTKETKDAKVIMMTALSQAEDKARAEKLGADRYLVKSQVTLEDVAKVAKEVLEGKPAAPAQEEAPAAAPAESAAPAAAAAAATTLPEPAATAAAPSQAPAAAAPEPAAQPQQQPAADPAQPQPAAPAATQPPAADPVPVVPAPDPAADDQADPEEPKEGSEASGRKKTIEPLNNIKEDSETKLKELLEKEKQREQMEQGVQETVAKQEAKPVQPAEGADNPTKEAPVQPPAEDAAPGPDPNSIAL